MTEQIERCPHGFAYEPNCNQCNPPKLIVLEQKIVVKETCCPEMASRFESGEARVTKGLLLMIGDERLYDCPDCKSKLEIQRPW